MHLDEYFNQVSRELGKNAIDQIEIMRQTCARISKIKIENFDNTHSSKILLMGEVQSGKTAQMLAAIAMIADASPLFKTFVLLTTSNIALQQQTLFRCMSFLPSFVICGENDDLRFRANSNRTPCLIVLKKNSPVLKRWRNILLGSETNRVLPIVIVDDEADATSLNTAINRKEQSQINNLLEQITSVSSSSIFIQVTATPQALFLQDGRSGWKPEDCVYFQPGKGYLGGDFFFSDPPPYAFRQTSQNELQGLRLASSFYMVPEGFKRAIASYLLASTYLLDNGTKKTSFLIHPSWKQESHSLLEDKANMVVGYIKKNALNSAVSSILLEEWVDLQKTLPEISTFESLISKVMQNSFPVRVINSNPNSKTLVDFENGSNIVIGGNSLGRGLTFPMLLTVYYCRESKIPQMDTIWQHCRMFGYDRLPGLSRMFMPGDLYDLFSETHSSNKALVKSIKSGAIDKIQIITNSRVRPTRMSVVDQENFYQIVGGVNYFPNCPDQKRWASNIVEPYILELAQGDFEIELPVPRLIKLLDVFKSDDSGEWSTDNMINALTMYLEHRNSSLNAVLFVRKNRDISFGTGTLLSPNDRKKSDSFPEMPVVFLYEINGDLAKGWDGSSFWIPNIRLPDNYVFNFIC